MTALNFEVFEQKYLDKLNLEKASVAASDLNIYKSKEIESLYIEIDNISGKNCIVRGIYKHPSSGTKSFIKEHLNKSLDIISSEKKHVVITGDFNINLLDYDKDESVSTFIDSWVILPKSVPCPLRNDQKLNVKFF